MHSLSIILITLLASAFFSGMEIAFLTANKLRLELDKKQGLLSSQIISIFSKKPGKYIATMLVGNNIALVIFGITMAELLEPKLKLFIASDATIMILQTIFSTLLILITAEFLPKALFRAVPNTVLKVFALPLLFFYLVFYPITQFIVSISQFFIRYIFKAKTGINYENYVLGKIDLDKFIQDVRPEHLENSKYEYEIKVFQNALDFSSVKLRDCMIPRTEIVAVDENCSIEELKQRFIETGFSKILIYEDSIDNIIGYVSSKDLFKNPQSIKSAIIRLVIVPETMNANKLLRILLQERKSLALVVDEFGGTSGIVAIEDIMEEIFGEIEDEHDTDDLVEKQYTENTFVFSARLEIEYLNEKYKLQIHDSDEYTTLSGFIFFNLGRIPGTNERFTIDRFDFKIIKANNTRLELIFLKVLTSE